jgi:hypothetical protein
MLVDNHRSYPATIDHRRPTPFAPPHRRHAILVRPCSLLLSRHLPYGPLKISGNTLPPSSHRRATGERAVFPVGYSLGPVFGLVLCPGI